MKMAKKFDDLNEAFNVAGDIVSREVESVEEKVETIAASISNDLKKIMNTLEEIYILLLRKDRKLLTAF